MVSLSSMVMRMMILAFADSQQSLAKHELNAKTNKVKMFCDTSTLNLNTQQKRQRNMESSSSTVAQVACATQTPKKQYLFKQETVRMTQYRHEVTGSDELPTHGRGLASRYTKRNPRREPIAPSEPDAWQ